MRNAQFSKLGQRDKVHRISLLNAFMRYKPFGL